MNQKSAVRNQKSEAAAAVPPGPPTLADLLRKSSVRLWLATELVKSNAELRNGPGGTWDFGNESKRQAITDLNNALRALGKIVTG